LPPIIHQKTACGVKNINKNLRIGGEVFEYHWVDTKTEEEWEGKFKGYGLCNLTDKETIKRNILDKLYLKDEGKK